jgi:hypothetical protein
MACGYPCALFLPNRGACRHWRAVALSALLAVGLCRTPACRANDPANPILDVFPDSESPTFYENKSEFSVQSHLGARNSNWHPELDESSVFHARLQHKSVDERCWEIGIGKGGQMYSICSSFGEAMAPQTPQSQWMDETWQFTTVYAHLLGRDLPQQKRQYQNAFVHQSGIYTRDKDTKPFYSPILATRYNPARRAYSMLTWGQVPDASIHRSGVLVYVQYRDHGAGVIEVTYVIYNFENEPMNNLAPWGGVRTSVFPEHVVSNPDGSYRFFTPWSYGSPGCRILFEATGGWAAAVQNAANPHSYAIGVVFGRKLDKKGEHCGKPRYDCGNSRHGRRDYTVQATVINIKDRPFTAHLLRMYFVIGTLGEVAETANALVGYADYAPLSFTEAGTPLVPLYPRRYRSGQTVLSRRVPAGKGTQPLCKVYAHPVRGSLPLFVIKDNPSGHHFITTDPYAECEREPFENPCAPDHARYEQYENRTVYKAHMRKTDWVELLGFVMPNTEAAPSLEAIPLASVPGVEAVFRPGEKVEANAVMVRK